MDFLKPEHFRDLLRIYNTNVDGNKNVVYALKGIQGIGRRFANLVCKHCHVPITKRAGEITAEEEARIVECIANPTKFGIPVWALNRRKDFTTGEDLHLVTNDIAGKFREDMERMRKMRIHRGIRLSNGLKVRGQRTKCTGRRGRAVGVVRKK